MKVLLADDEPTTLLTLRHLVGQWGYEVLTAADGDRAWEILTRDTPPAMAVLDWMMPGLNGDEICRRLVGRNRQPFTYLILLTSKQEKNDKLSGLEAGAHDFLHKPVDADELRSRLSVGARIVAYEENIARKNELLRRYATEMEKLAAERARQLVHADRLASLGTLAAGVAHEINNPTAMISGNVQTMQKFWPYVDRALQAAPQADPDEQHKRAFILRELPKLLGEMQMGVQRTALIVKSLNAYSRKESEEKKPCALNDMVQQALNLAKTTLRHGEVEVVLNLAQSMPPVLATAQQIEQVLINIFINAAQAMERSAAKKLIVSTIYMDERACVYIEDTGPGIPADILGKIWDPFFTTKEAGKGTGLGLSISQNIIAAHNGTIAVENRAQGGARFVLRLPAGGPARA